MEIRNALPEDAERLLEIYAPYVRDTAVSFEYVVPDESEFRERIRKTVLDYPYLVAVDHGRITAYAYAGPFHQREAYRHSAEVSIYVDRNDKRKGTGKALYAELERILLMQNVFSVHACIAIPDGYDIHLNDDSMLFHSAMGYQTAGKHVHCGYKFGKWYSVIWMDKLLCERRNDPEPFLPFSKLQEVNQNLGRSHPYH